MVAACGYAYDVFDGLGLSVAYDPFTWQGHDLTNVVAIKPGTVDPSRIYILCGHLDSISQQPTVAAPGAEDNGSGAAAVLEAARLFAPLETAYTIYFICFSAEEQGLIGSEHFAADADAANLDIRGVLNLDMVAWYAAGGRDLWIEGFHYGTSSVTLMNLLKANTEAYTPLTTYLYPGEGWGSDHAPFHDHGFPAILSIEYEYDDYPCYHRACDAVSYLDADLWRGIVAANVISLGQLAEIQGEAGAVAGQVIVPGGDPLGATVRLSGTRYAEQTCATGGDFGWSSIFPGVYTLIAEKEGCVPDTSEVVVSAATVTEVSLVLMPVGATAIDETPGTAAGASVRLSISPSPMTATARVMLRLPGTRRGNLSVYAADGRRVAGLYRDGALHGDVSFTWDGRDRAGREVPAGIYWVRWEERGAAVSRPVAVVR